MTGRANLGRRLLALLLALASTMLAAPLRAEEPAAKDAAWFHEKVHPLLVKRCFKCHHGEEANGGLRLDSLGAMLTGGDSGPAIVPHKPDESLLVEAINYESYEMPPSGQMAEEEIALLTEWIARGAPWPGADPLAAAPAQPREQFSAEDRAWWAFQPLQNPTPPEVKDEDWCRNEIDRFILARLEAEGLTPAAPADRAMLVRRLYFDLLGVPPTPEEVVGFLQDDSPRAYENLVDRLLEDPRYGERQARFWLDLVRYAESDGFRQDAYRPTAWRYRDWVIEALNEDMPYDQFVTHQLAADELLPDDPAAQVATGYYRLGIYEYNQRDARIQRRDMLNDITDTTGEVFLGLGYGCAKCHNHKFDPILQADYFRLQAFFEPLIFRDDAPVATAKGLAEYHEQLAAWEAETEQLRRQIAEIEAPYRAAQVRKVVEIFPPDIQAIYNTPADERDSYEAQLAYLVQRQVDDKIDRFEHEMKGETKAKWKALQQKLAETKRPTRPPTALAVQDYQGAIAETLVPDRRQPKPVAAGFLTLLEPEPATIEPLEHSSGRRLALARWITQPDNPLSTRVIVNRLWQFHFGCGLVATSSDFGRLGEPPSHPQLLDWLARRFVAEGWSLKKTHRLIVTSATYRQTAVRQTPEIARQIDPSNRLLWRMATRRLDAEQIRDAILTVSGELETKRGGPSVDSKMPRRTVYTKMYRNQRDPLLDAFDLPERITSAAERNVTTTPIQSLLMINSKWTLARAEAFAERLRGSAHDSPGSLVEEAYRIALSREPNSIEREQAVAFLRREDVPREAPERGWVTDFPHREGTAINIPGNGRPDLLRVPNSEALPTGDFTVEAYVLLRSTYKDATVRTIVSCWDTNTGHPGWSLGVTSEQSAYEPRNLILQLVGDPEKGGAGYEVIPSGLHLELNQPYYVAVSVRIKDTSPAGVTFYLKNLSQDGVVQVAHAPHTVTGHYRSKHALHIGSRDQPEYRHHWDGLIDDVRVTRAALDMQQLLLSSGAEHPEVSGLWRFEDEPGVLENSFGPAGDIEPPALNSSDQRALIDFCHVLLNSNEFLYID